jgi:hypothetical protein
MYHKKDISPNGLAGLQVGDPGPVQHRASHSASHRPRGTRSESGRRWGLHLVRRNGIFHFRRRWPLALRSLGAPEFLSVSLRTHLLGEAVKRKRFLGGTFPVFA